MVVESLPPEFVASMVIEAVLKTAFGVPVIAPVVELNDKPDGSEPLVIDQELDAPPVLLGDAPLIAEFLVKLNGDPA